MVKPTPKTKIYRTWLQLQLQCLRLQFWLQYKLQPRLMVQIDHVLADCRDFLAKWWRWIVAACVLAPFLCVLLYTGYWVPGTGFGGYNNARGEWQREKTLWDWMDLLLVPVLLALGAWLVSRAARERERQTELDRSRQAALQTYLDRVTALLRDEWHESGEGFLEANIIRAQTLTVLRQLDGDRKGLLLQFLYESGLIGKWESKKGLQAALVDLSGANLREISLWNVNLSGADLSGTSLPCASLLEVNLSRANLREAILHEASLTLSDLRGVDLSGAYLIKAHLVKVDLSGANLREANLGEADLYEADLTDAIVTGEQLAQAKTLRDMTMPDGTKYTGKVLVWVRQAAKPKSVPAEAEAEDAQGQPEKASDLDAGEGEHAKLAED